MVCALFISTVIKFLVLHNNLEKSVLVLIGIKRQFDLFVKKTKTNLFALIEK